MFDYYLDLVVKYHTELLNESSYVVRKHLIALIKDLLKELPKEFDPYAFTGEYHGKEYHFDDNDGKDKKF